MGGAWGKVEGQTKLATWLAFQKERKELRSDSDDTEEELYSGSLYLIFPGTKKDAFRRMVRKEDGSGWILEYHLHN